jgi:hypothetical protein
VREWLFATADYCAENRTVRLVYSHPYNLYEADGGHDYRPAFTAWLDHLEALRDSGRLQVRPMIAFADHLLRVVAADLRCTPAAGRLRVELTVPGGLRDLAVALPKRLVGRPRRPGIRVEEDARYWYLILEDDAHELALDLDAR